MAEKPYVMFPSLAFFEVRAGYDLQDAVAAFMRRMASETSFSKDSGMFVWIYATRNDHIYARYMASKRIHERLEETLALNLVEKIPFYRGCHLKVIK